MIKILVTGDRNWTDHALILDEIKAAIDAVEKPPSEIMIIEGGAKGADKFASEAAFALGCHSHTYPADWQGKGRAAGPIRNQEMLDMNADISLVLAFHDNLKESRGTRDMIRRARKKNIPILHISHTVARVWLSNLDDLD